MALAPLAAALCMAFPASVVAGDMPLTSGMDQAALSTTHEPNATADYNRGGIFDEVRLGGLVSVQGDSPDGALIGGQILFDPVVPPSENYLFNALLRPRAHIGGLFATDDGTDQLYAGFTWNFPIFDIFFLEASFGGGVHDGPLDSDPGVDDESLGCRLTFRESVGAGVNLGRNLRLLASLDHSSNASLCNHNGGLTHAGASLGYRF